MILALTTPELIEFLDFRDVMALSRASWYLRERVLTDEILQNICEKKLHIYLRNLTTIKALNLLEKLCMKKINDLFIILFQLNPLFRCPAYGGSDPWFPSMDPEIQEYALYLSMKYDNNRLYEIIINDKKTFHHLNEARICKINLYYAGLNNLPNHPYVQKIRSEIPKRKECYEFYNYFYGLKEAGHINTIKAEILKPEIRFWYISTVCYDPLEHEGFEYREVKEAQSLYVGKTDLDPVKAGYKVVESLVRKKIYIYEEIEYNPEEKDDDLRFRTKSNLCFEIPNNSEFLRLPWFELEVFKDYIQYNHKGDQECICYC